jgi:exodeoxyribonuclease VII small subunit
MKENNFEKKLKNSKEILDKLLNPDITLSDSMTLYKDGLKELKEANKMLEDAKVEFIELSDDEDTQNRAEQNHF